MVSTVAVLGRMAAGARCCVFLIVFLVPLIAWAEPADDSFELTSGVTDSMVKLGTECSLHVEALSEEIARTTKLANIFMVIGAAIAALGSACAASLEKTQARWLAAVIGIAGAIVTVLPKTLKDKDDLNHRLTLTDAHRTVGYKIFRELQIYRTGGLKRLSVQYVMARFTDCTAAVPLAPVPDLPVYELAMSGDTVAERAQPAGERAQPLPERAVLRRRGPKIEAAMPGGKGP